MDISKIRKKLKDAKAEISPESKVGILEGKAEAAAGEGSGEKEVVQNKVPETTFKKDRKQQS